MKLTNLYLRLSEGLANEFDKLSLNFYEVDFVLCLIIANHIANKSYTRNEERLELGLMSEERDKFLKKLIEISEGIFQDGLDGGLFVKRELLTENMH